LAQDEGRKKTEVGSDVLAWVSKSRQIEENKNAAKERASHLPKIFEEQVPFFTVFPVFSLAIMIFSMQF
jgi:hypothetical protein